MIDFLGYVFFTPITIYAGVALVGFVHAALSNI